MSEATPREIGISVLVVEDDARMRDILTRHLERLGYAVQAAEDAASALGVLRELPFDVVLSDVRMPGMDGHSLMQVVREKHPGIKVVLMTAFGTVDAAVDAMQAGAYSYVCKPFKVEEIAAVLRNAAREISLTRQVERLRRIPRGMLSADSLVGISESMREVRRSVREAAAVTSPVLITGRSGTGKELAARAIHNEGPRREGPFMPVNCAAIPETLFESEMFGHTRGAFTGAREDRPGLIEQSSGGTLFLDEAGEIPLPQQAKLLRVLEEGVVRRLGASESIPVDLRVVCATNRSLEAMIRQGEFREDLYFRLNVLQVKMPELSTHPEDIPALADHLLSRLVDETGIHCHGIEPVVHERLGARRWPGNVRELRNTIERAMLKARGRRIAVEDLPGDLQGEGPSVDEATPGAPGALRPLSEVEKEHIDAVLRACDWNRSAAAKVLGIDRRTLFSKIQRYGLIGPNRQGRG
ncbi:MAG: sigma-54 dependent transcriptional regulator [Deltaproteobacteria bacterium]|nr:sigma-54 dependent transcriptional regulator [Deltaproteobacteria bacterium]